MRPFRDTIQPRCAHVPDQRRVAQGSASSETGMRGRSVNICTFVPVKQVNWMPDQRRVDPASAASGTTSAAFCVSICTFCTSKTSKLRVPAHTGVESGVAYYPSQCLRLHAAPPPQKKKLIHVNARRDVESGVERLIRQWLCLHAPPLMNWII